MTNAERCAKDNYPDSMYDDGMRAACAVGYMQCEREILEKTKKWIREHCPSLDEAKTIFKDYFEMIKQ